MTTTVEEVPGGVDLLSLPDAAIDRELCRRSLREFVRGAWEVLHPNTDLRWNWHHDLLCDRLERVTSGEIQQLIVNVPPGFTKSLTVSVFWPAWVWTRDPSRQFMAASYSGELSTRDTRRCRQVIKSDWYQRRWGDLFDFEGDEDRKTRFENDRAGFRIATSVGGSVTGERADVLILDDPHKTEEELSEARLSSDLGWLDSTWSTRHNDPRESADVVVMQRLHQEDATGHLLSQWDEVEHLCLPMEYEPDHPHHCPEDPRTEEGELLHPERFDRESVETLKRRLGSYGSSGQLQQRPSPAEGGIIKRGWWQFHRFDVPAFDQLIQSWDMAFKGKETSDYVVGQVWGRVGSDKFLLDQRREKLEFTDAIEAVLEMTRKWPKATAKYVEDKANGPAVMSALSGEVSGLIPYDPGERSKAARYRAVSPQIEAGDVHLPHPDEFPWVEAFIEECARAPNGAHDDQADAMAQALDVLEAEVGADSDFAFV